MRSISLKQASEALSQAENALSVQRAIAAAARDAGREAIAAGDRAEWMLITTQATVATSRMNKVEGLRVARTTSRDAALTEFLESRVKTEQIEQLVDAMRQQAEAAEMRRTQAEADDRYLARMRWRMVRDVR
ncbi:hypothetical protein [Granulicella sibirica]|nr:hypothetical protein [Granulicella sibirica]